MPERIQLRRTRGYRKPEGTIVVARPSKWGNPFKVGEVVAPEAYGYLTGPFRPDLLKALAGLTNVKVPNRAQAVEAYGWWIVEQPALMLAIPHELAGHDLACWCPLEDSEGHRVPCHADVLLELAREG